MSYLALTDADREAMLEEIGVSSIEELFADLPEGVRLRRELNIRPAMTEQELTAYFEELASQNATSLRSCRSSARACTTTTCRRSWTPSSSAASS